MEFSDTTTEQGIVQDARYLVGANATSYPIKDLTRNANRWLDKATSIIFKADGRWQFDDANYTDYPFATANLVSGQQDYVLAVSHLTIDRVEIKNADGNWVRLKPFDKRDVETSIEEFYSTDGTPIYYDVVANSVFLYPAPSYSQDDSVKVWFKRGASYFATSDTTKKPGFASIFHRYISLGCAYDYALKNNLTNRNQLREEIVGMEQEMQKFYAHRQKDESIRLTVKKKSYK